MSNNMTELILFHHFKHHLGFLKEWVAANAGNADAGVIAAMKTLGSSQLDMYCGGLTVNEILQQCSIFLQQQGINNIAQFKQWVGSNYKLFTLTDGSGFTIRYIDHIKPVHIHPSRHVPHTMRIKANALKTAVCYVLQNGNAGAVSISTLNTLRKQYLELSPVSEKTAVSEIEKAIKLFIKTAAGSC